MAMLIRALLALSLIAASCAAAGSAFAQKPGGILKVYFFDSPATMSICWPLSLSARPPTSIRGAGMP